MKLNQIKPVGPHIEGIIRFASEGQGDDMRQFDYFDVCSRVHQAPQEGSLPSLMPHPITEKLAPQGAEGEQKKVRVIPIRLIADKPSNSLKARYEAYDTEIGRLLCVGDGENGERAVLSQGSSSSCQCAGPEACDYANQPGVQCSLHVRLKVQIEGQEDPFSVFELHSGSINTFRTLSAKLEMMSKAFGGKLRGLPLELAAYAKSSVASAYQPFYVADLRVRSNLTPAAAMAERNKMYEAESSAGLSFDAMESAIESMEANSALRLGDCEPSVITFSPVVVDRTKLRREGEPVPVSVRTAVPSDIAQLVSQAMQSAKATASLAVPGAELAQEPAEEPVHQDTSASPSAEQVEQVVHDGGFDAAVANMVEVAVAVSQPPKKVSQEAPAFPL